VQEDEPCHIGSRQTFGVHGQATCEIGRSSNTLCTATHGQDPHTCTHTHTTRNRQQDQVGGEQEQIRIGQQAQVRIRQPREGIRHPISCDDSRERHERKDNDYTHIHSLNHHEEGGE
jgi:hypothetical protein